MTAAFAVPRTRCVGVTGVAVRRTTTRCVVPDVASVVTSVSATTTDLLSAAVSAPTTSVDCLYSLVIAMYTRNTKTLGEGRRYTTDRFDVAAASCYFSRRVCRSNSFADLLQ